LGSSVGHASYDITFTTAPAGDFVHLFSLTQITDCSIHTAGHLHFPVILPSFYQTNRAPLPMSSTSSSSAQLHRLPRPMARRGIANYEPAQPNEFNIFWQEILRHGNDGISGSLANFFRHILLSKSWE